MGALADKREPRTVWLTKNCMVFKIFRSPNPSVYSWKPTQADRSQSLTFQIHKNPFNSSVSKFGGSKNL